MYRFRDDVDMSDEREEWTYKGPVELVGTVRGEDGRLTVEAELRITVQEERAFDAVLPSLREWSGTSVVSDRTGALRLSGRYEVVMPWGQSGEAWVEASAQSVTEPDLEWHVSIQGIGRAPWLP